MFAELDAYSSQEDIRTAYGYEMISESEMDRLMNLWELREQSKQTEGPYRDRCVEMLELAGQAVWVPTVRQFLHMKKRYPRCIGMRNGSRQRIEGGILRDPDSEE